MTDTDINAVEAALAILNANGFNIASPRDGDLDDLEQERFNAVADACRAYAASENATLRAENERLERERDEAIKHKITAQQRLKTAEDSVSGWKQRAARLETRAEALSSENVTIRAKLQKAEDERDKFMREAGHHFAKSCKLAERAEAAERRLAEQGQAQGDARKTIERAIVEAMGWSPSEDGPGFFETKNAVLDQITQFVATPPSPEPTIGDERIYPNEAFGSASEAPSPEPDDINWHVERLDAIVRGLWAVHNIDLHMSDGTIKPGQSGVLQNIRDSWRVVRRALRRHRKQGGGHG